MLLGNPKADIRAITHLQKVLQFGFLSKQFGFINLVWFGFFCTPLDMIDTCEKGMNHNPNICREKGLSKEC